MVTVTEGGVVKDALGREYMGWKGRSMQARSQATGFHYEGSPCRVCGGTKRQVSGGNCVRCRHERWLQRLAARKLSVTSP